LFQVPSTPKTKHLAQKKPLRLMSFLSFGGCKSILVMVFR
jgi:hypothetical protein